MIMPRFAILLLLSVTTSLPFAIGENLNPLAEPGKPNQELPGVTPPSREPAAKGTTLSDSADRKPDYSKEAFVVEQLHEYYRFENDGTGRKESTLRVRVQSEAGVKGFGQLRFGYNAANDRLDIGYVHVIKQDGSVVTAGPDAVQDLSAAVQSIAPVYTDYREKHVTVPGLQPGDTLEVQVKTVIQTAYAPGQFWMQHDFNRTSVVLDEQLDIDIPADRAIKLKHATGGEPRVTEEKGRRIYHWSESHLVQGEEGRSDKSKTKKKKQDTPPDIQVTTFASWEEVGRWYAGLEKDRRIPTKEVKAKADELTKGLTSDSDKVQALYDFVATNFRYVSLSLGLARYQPQSATDVLRNQYGDCKDKNTLLAALLEAEGFHSSTVLIGSVHKLDPDVPSPSQFDHAITMLPLGKEEIWMDTTTEVAPFRLLAYKLRKKQALVIPQAGVPHLQATPADPPTPDRQELEIKGKVDESGKLVATLSYTLRGDSELRERMLFRAMAPTQWQKYAEGINKRLGGDVSNVKASDATATRQPFTISYDVSKPKFIDWEKKKTQLRLPFAYVNLAAVSEDTAEEHTDAEEESADKDLQQDENLKLGPPNEQVYRWKLEFAPRFTVDTPVGTTVTRDYAVYESSYKLEGFVLTAERKFNLQQAELPPARNDDYQAFRQAVFADEKQQLTIESTAGDSHSIPEGMKASELVKSGNEARKNGHYELAVELFKRAIELDPKAKDAWNDLGIVYLNDQRDELAIEAFKKQIDINSYHSNAYDNLGRVYLQERKYEEAEKWFQKQIEIQPLHQHALSNLGTAYLETEKYQEAVPLLEKAASLAPDEAVPQVRLGEAYLRLGQDDKAMSAFDKAVKISATSAIWNDIAYQLAISKTHLDLARRYAESAVSGTASRLRNISLDHLKQQDLSLVSSLASYWDTLGWVAFSEGNVESAEKYVLAAWQLSGGGAAGDHIGRIYEKEGKTEEAEHYFALAMSGRRPELKTRSRLTNLLGDDAKVDRWVERYRGEMEQCRTIKVANSTKAEGSADFFVLLSSAQKGAIGVEGVSYISGSDKLKTMTEDLRAGRYIQTFPDDTQALIVRRGTLTCRANSDCTFLLAWPWEVKSVD
jgi:tetratricopeptide (TPR) repeat protein